MPVFQDLVGAVQFGQIPCNSGIDLAQASVSHNAPYKHFADKRVLLAAVSAAGFELLTTRITEATERLSNPRAQLAAVARAYVSHSLENPALYRLMFGGFLTGTDGGRPVIERAAGEKMKAKVLQSIVNGALGKPIPNTTLSARKLAGALLVFWSQLHGLTSLLVDGRIGPSTSAKELTGSLLQGMIDGLATTIPSLPLGAWVGPPDPPK